MNVKRVTSAVVFVGLATTWLSARQGPPMAPAVAANTSITGFWELSFDSRKIPPADLLPSVTKLKIQQHLDLDAHAIRWCNLLGMPFLMDSGRPLDILDGETAVMIASETLPNPRYLYKRSAHIDPNIWDPNTTGDSIAHWEGDTLIAETVGFADNHGITAIPGGGYRTGKSKLVERFRLLENGAMLSVVSTWTDPTVFKTPHSYEFRYYRLPASYEPRDSVGCNPYNAVRAEFLGDPTEKPARGRSAGAAAPARGAAAPAGRAGTPAAPAGRTGAPPSQPR